LQELASKVRGFFASKATVITARFRAVLAKMRFKKAKASAGRMQALVRMMRQKKQFKEEKVYMTKIQSLIRGKLERKGYGVKLRKETDAAKKMQATRRMMVKHKEYLKQLEMVKKIEATFRMHKAEAEFQEDKKKTVFVQAAARAYLSRKEKSEKLFSVARMQVAIRAFLRNAALSNDVLDLHGLIRQGRVDEVLKKIKAEPELKIIRNRCATQTEHQCDRGVRGASPRQPPSDNEKGESSAHSAEHELILCSESIAPAAGGFGGSPPDSHRATTKRGRAARTPPSTSRSKSASRDHGTLFLTPLPPAARARAGTTTTRPSCRRPPRPGTWRCASPWTPPTTTSSPPTPSATTSSTTPLARPGSRCASSSPASSTRPP
jgi:hypothetical protein